MLGVPLRLRGSGNVVTRSESECNRKLGMPGAVVTAAILERVVVDLDFVTGLGEGDRLGVVEYERVCEDERGAPKPRV